MAAERVPPWLRHDGPPQGEGPGPDGPQPGELYHVDAEILSRRDAHPDRYRPVVVVKVFADLRLVRVYTRTSDLTEPGVRHRKDVALGLSKDGVFGERWDQSIDLGLFRYPLVIRRGLLDEGTFSKVLDMWERS